MNELEVRLLASLKRIKVLSEKRRLLENATRRRIIKANVSLNCECEERDRILKQLGRL